MKGSKLMTNEDIFKTIVSILREKVLDKKDVEIEQDTVLVTELAMDSLDRVLFVDELEEAFNIEIDTDEIVSIQTVGDVVKSIGEKLSETSGE